MWLLFISVEIRAVCFSPLLLLLLQDDDDDNYDEPGLFEEDCDRLFTSYYLSSVK